ncbi:adapter protein MecA 1/2 [Pilibacter termitis]|uniref:Adapter protein MecA n=1 Tax=Pilibacter termitis TaxID=263852 RepID=A0A1T4P8J5_9ENTE|nr:adaptor protein MecA [Pilibacter termitis]SJZ87576.1 adapter protein MecA 1/2 [Pilibacter termitis]
MEMERVNDNTIRVTIFPDDLARRGVNFLDMMGNQEKIEDFFFSVIDEVGARDQFQGSEMLSFQVIPRPNALELLISNGDISPIDAIRESMKKNGSVIEPLQNEVDSLIGDILSSEEDIDEMDELVLSFDDFEEVIALAKQIDAPDVFSSLYKLEDLYYLVAWMDVDDISVEESESVLSVLLEYGEEAEVTGDYLHEHANLLMKKTALEQLREFFSK